MPIHYNPHTVECNAQQFWKDHDCFKVTQRDLHRPKFYGLCAFPYPSGELHIGHVRNYVLGDAVARYQRMQGKQVIHPIGWDAFGLPAENAALHQRVNPEQWTYANIERMKEQFQRLGLSYDWDRELATCHPSYYRWEQWLFTKLFAKGLAYRKTSWVNWDPVDQTILANEQVIGGRGWRSGAVIQRKAIPQWFLKITDYTESLLNELETLTEWPESVKTMQHRWIGRSRGVVVRFAMSDESNVLPLDVFTTRLDTLMGVSYIVIAKDHPLAQKAASHDVKIQAFIDECSSVPTSEASEAIQEKRGIFSGYYVKHPITTTVIPVWIGNFVEMTYATGAVMAVPAHDVRDFAFAKQYHLPIQPVIAPNKGPLLDYTQAPYTKEGVLIHSESFTGLSSQKARQAILQDLIESNLAYPKTYYRLRDWGISRQRYWGTPIPMIHCQDCGAVPVPLHDLPVVLPHMTTLIQGKAPPPLSEIPEFYETNCPICQKKAQRETDTFDTFVESSWYFLRFLCPNSNTMLADDISTWLPVDHYIIGVEHAVLHLLYARFFYKLLHSLDLLPKDGGNQEPFKQLLTQGMVLKEGTKMSKSKGNVVDPMPLIQQYGADTLRLFILFAAPPKQSLEWSDSGLLGANRFLKRLWQLVHQISWVPSPQIDWHSFTPKQKRVRAEIHSLLKLANQDYQRYQFNTVIATCMKLFNVLQPISVEPLTDQHSPQWQAIIKEGLSILLRLLAPLVPHITHSLWDKTNLPGIMLDAPWPMVDESALTGQQHLVVIQINGKRRTVLSVDSTSDLALIKQMALSDKAVQPYLREKTVQKLVVVPTGSRVPSLINIVVA